MIFRAGGRVYRLSERITPGATARVFIDGTELVEGQDFTVLPDPDGFGLTVVLEEDPPAGAEVRILRHTALAWTPPQDTVDKKAWGEALRIVRHALSELERDVALGLRTPVQGTPPVASPETRPVLRTGWVGPGDGSPDAAADALTTTVVRISGDASVLSGIREGTRVLLLIDAADNVNLSGAISPQGTWKPGAYELMCAGGVLHALDRHGLLPRYERTSFTYLPANVASLGDVSCLHLHGGTVRARLWPHKVLPDEGSAPPFGMGGATLVLNYFDTAPVLDLSALSDETTLTVVNVGSAMVTLQPRGAANFALSPPFYSGVHLARVLRTGAGETILRKDVVFAPALAPSSTTPQTGDTSDPATDNPDAGTGGTPPDTSPTPPPNQDPGTAPPPDAPPPIGPISTVGASAELNPAGELPVPLRTVVVRNSSELSQAIAAARPGDEIVLEDGDYGGPYFPGALRGTAENPIVFRARNLLGAKVPMGFRLEDPNAAHVWFWGLDFKYREWTETDSAGNTVWKRTGGFWFPVNGTDIRFVRCRFHPPAPEPDTSKVALVLRSCRDVWLVNCDFGMDTNAEAAKFGLTSFGINYGVVWQYQTQAVFDSGMWSQNTRIVRCYLYGGLTDVPYSYPNSQWIESGGDPRLTNADTYPYDWDVRYCYGELTRASTNIDFKGNRCRLFRCHLRQLDTSGPGAIQLREGWDHTVEECRLENIIVEMVSYRHKVINAQARIVFGSGSADTFDTSDIGAWRRATACEAHRIDGPVYVGFGGTWPYPPKDCSAHACAGPITIRQTPENWNEYPDSPYPAATPPVLSRAETGVHAPWFGWYGDGTTTGSAPATWYWDPPARPGTGGFAPAPGELPTPVRTVNVSNRAELDAALADAQPGDEIVIADGAIIDRIELPHVSGSLSAPVVIRSATCLGAKIGGLVVRSGAVPSDIVFWGLDFEDTVQPEGTSLTFLRCRFSARWPGDGGYACGLFVRRCPNLLVERCTFWLETTPEWEQRTGETWQAPTTSTRVVGVLISGFDEVDLQAGQETENAVFRHCHFAGGPNTSGWGRPFSCFVQVTDWSYLSNGTFEIAAFESCRFEAAVGGTLIAFLMACGVRFTGCEMASPAGASWFVNKRGVGNLLETCTLSKVGGELGQTVVVDSCDCDLFWVVPSGDLPGTDLEPHVRSHFWAGENVEFHNTTGEVRLGYSDSWAYPANDTRLWNCSGPVVERHATGTFQSADPHPDRPPRTPATVPASAVGVDS